ncbi:MAG: hypothetical protein JSR48_12115 [Verrucomicrobia bacterium]|nr:hypothetical protein [Verrucomicrobiota bacterium]
MRFRPALLSLLALAAMLVASCGHYQLGTDGRLAFTTLYVAPVGNATMLPQAQAIVSTQLRETFGRNGRVTLVNEPAAADATLTVTLKDYHRDVRAVREDDTGLARKFALTLGAEVTLHDNRNSRDLLAKRAVSVSRDAFTDGGQLQSEYQTVPLLAEALAQKVSHAVLDVW